MMRGNGANRLFKMRKRFVRLTIGDRVRMQMSPYDLNKARIVWRIG